MLEISKQQYGSLLNDIGIIIEQGRREAYVNLSNIISKTYWGIGKTIIEFEQKGKKRADYGKQLLDKLYKDLKLKYGKGFSRSNVYAMRQFYIAYPNFPDTSGKLTWSHFLELISITDDLARGFYEKQSIKENWSVRELKRQINSMLFERIALSKDKKGVLKLSEKGQIFEKDQDIIKEPYVLEFLGIPENHKYSEKELEQKIIDNLQMFLLELGKGFTFVKRQFRITLSNRHFYVDLVFYHRILKCFVLIDLKIGEVNHGDIGQMNMYLNYFKKEEGTKDDNEPIGLILSARKHDITVEYALGSISNKLFVSKYQLYLPNKKELEKEFKKLLEENGGS
jgi:predicted nuclease of restriction endonuclease-like (RecB) superfamily